MRLLHSLFLKLNLLEKAHKNDCGFKDAFNIQDQYPKLGHALLRSMQRHSWYITEHLIPLALDDDDMDEEEKMNIIIKLSSNFRTNSGLVNQNYQ